jgi:hypothetical protein
MFKYMYNINSETSAKGAPVEEAILSVKLLSVADKYQCAGLFEAAPRIFLLRLDKVLYEIGRVWMSQKSEDDGERSAASGEMLAQVVEAVYELQGNWPGKDKSPITEHLLTTMFEHYEFSPFSDLASQDKALQIVAQEVPRFGSDLFVGMMKRRGSDIPGDLKEGWRHCYRRPCVVCNKPHLTPDLSKRYCKDCVHVTMRVV